MTKPQRPGDLLLFEDHFYLVVPNDLDYFPDKMVEARKEAGGPQRCRSVRIEAAPLRLVRDDESFALVLRHAAAQLVRAHARYVGTRWFPAWRLSLVQLAADLLAQAKGHRATGKRIWYAPDRLFSNPDTLSIPLNDPAPVGVASTGG